MSTAHHLHKEYPKTRPRGDFWGQVKRAVNGRPVGEDQIALIVAAIVEGLVLGPADTLLDLCCGNGALSDRLFAQCRGGLGVDFSESLVEVAHERFQRRPDRVYVLGDVAAHVARTADTARFTRALCYGAFSYLPEESARALLTGLRRRFPGLRRVFVGNLPDRDAMRAFYGDNPPAPGTERDPGSPIGIWRSEAELAALAARCGWAAEVRRMPHEFYAAHYRYDAVLTPAE